MKSLVVLCSMLLLCSCVSFKGKDELKPKHVEMVSKVESFYLDRARNLAAEHGSCDSSKVTASAIGYVERDIVLSMKTIYRGKTIRTIAVSACGVEQVYQVSCGKKQRYGSPVCEELTPCDINKI